MLTISVLAKLFCG